MPRRWTSVRCQGRRRGENSLRQTIEAAQGATCWGTNCRTSRSITWLKSPKTTDIMEWLQQYIPSAFCGFLRLQWLPHMWHADYFVPGLFVSVSLNHYSINMLVMSTCFQIFQGSRHTLLNVVWPIVVFILPHPTALIVLAMNGPSTNQLCSITGSGGASNVGVLLDATWTRWQEVWCFYVRGWLSQFLWIGTWCHMYSSMAAPQRIDKYNPIRKMTNCDKLLFYFFEVTVTCYCLARWNHQQMRTFPTLQIQTCCLLVCWC